MRQVSPALQALLASNTSFVMADLYTLTLVGGATYYYSGAPTALTANGKAYLKGPAFARSKTKTVIGTQIGSMQVSIYPAPTDLLPPGIAGSPTLLQAAWQGQLDGAILTLERAFMASYGDTSPGTVVLFGGRVSTVDCSRTEIRIECKSHLELLNIQMPRRLWQSDCTHVFGGPMCLFDRTTLQVTVTAFAGSTRGAIVAGFAPSPLTLYDQGSIIGQSGNNLGVEVTVKQVLNGTINVMPAFFADIAPGDQFLLLPGCDRTQNTCLNVYNNLIHFGGFPYIPTPETAV